MENPEKLTLTSEEVDRLGKALKDERFRDMLHEYVQEISDPETRRQYEEEMTLLEQQRGNNIEFIHPTPFKALKTSVDGKHKCFINICASDKVGKPECKSGVSEDGRRGQHWTLPHSLLPGRQDSDPKGNKVIIYDVVFHPDTLHIASKDKRFMDLVVSTAVNGIQDTLKVTLDKKNVRQLNAKYKGTPQPCVIRKPISGYKAKEASENPDPLAFPIQDEIRPNATHNCDSKADESVQIQPQEASAPTKPRFTVKYRSFIDLQDYRCSRDSATSPRPKEIVVTVDLPLLKSVRDTDLEVKERSLLLDSKKPAYRLELPLAYPVDEDKGQAKFNKQRGQLTVTLPVLPSTEAWDSAMFGSPGAQGSAGGDDDDDDKENEMGGTTGVEQPSGVEEEWIQEELKQQTKSGEDPAEDREEVLEGQERNVEQEEEREVQMTKVLEGEEQHVEGEEEREEQMTKVLEGEEQNVEGEEEREEQMTKVLEGEEQNVEGEEEREEQMTKVLEGEEQNVEGEEEREEQMTKVLEGEEQNVEGEEEREEQMTKVLEGEEQNVKGEEEREEQMTKVLEGEEQNVKGEEEREERMTKVLEGKDLGEGVKGQEEKCRKQRREGEESEVVIHVEEATWKEQNREGEVAAVKTPHVTGETENTKENVQVKADESHTATRTASLHDTAEAGSASLSGPGKRDESEETDEDDLQTEQVFETKGPEAALLREKDADGNEKVISDHSTSAGFVFRNTLIYTLD